MSELIHKALEKKPELRFSSVSAFVEALKRPTADLDVSSEAATLMVPSAAITGAAAGRSTAGPPRVSQPPTPPTPIPTGKLPPATRPTRRRAPVVVGIAAAAVLGVGGWWLFLRPEPPPAAPPRSETASQPGGAAGAQNTPPTQAPVTPPEVPAAPTTGRVTVTGLPTGGTITADGARQSGSTFELPPGRHQLRLSARGYSDVTVPITVAAGERQTVAFTGQRVAAVERRDPPATRPREGPATPPPAAAAEVGIIQVLIRPWANLTIDGRSYAQQSRFADTLLAGNHQMRFERAGFVTRDTVITLRAGQTVTLRIDMQPRNPD